MSDRRAVFFAIAALVCVVLVPVAEDRFRNITVGVAVVYGALAVASYLDFRGRR